MTYYKVEGHKNLIRDNNTNAILNVSSTEYQNYIKSKNQKESEVKKINSIETEIGELKNDIAEIKNLLRNLINGSW